MTKSVPWTCHSPTSNIVIGSVDFISAQGVQRAVTALGPTTMSTLYATTNRRVLIIILFQFIICWIIATFDWCGVCTGSHVTGDDNLWPAIGVQETAQPFEMRNFVVGGWHTTKGNVVFWLTEGCIIAYRAHRVQSKHYCKASVRATKQNFNSCWLLAVQKLKH